MKPESRTEKQMKELTKTIGYVRVNLPSTIEDYQSGNGEGMWAIPETLEAKQAYDQDQESGQFWAYMANNSVYYPGKIEFGDAVLAEFRGENRAVAVWDDLQAIGK